MNIYWKKSLAFSSKKFHIKSLRFLEFLFERRHATNKEKQGVGTRIAAKKGNFLESICIQ